MYKDIKKKLLTLNATILHKRVVYASLKVTTNNIGDHIQIIAAQNLLSSIGVETGDNYIDRDNELATSDVLRETRKNVIMVMNGWFKRNCKQWPPAKNIVPIFVGLHLRVNKCPELLSKKSIRYFKRHAPIGCRDEYTCSLLSSKGVNAYISNCLSLTFPAREPGLSQAEKVFIVSRDDEILSHLPNRITNIAMFKSHYTDTSDFASNMNAAKNALELYRSQAGLVITTLLHCALPCIAMGIPVVVFYPVDNTGRRKSDEERFSSLARMTRVYDVNEIPDVDWNPTPINIDKIKDKIRVDMKNKLEELAQKFTVSS